METRNRANWPTAGARTGQYCEEGGPEFARLISDMAHRLELIARRGAFFSTVVVGVASAGVSGLIVDGERAEIMRAQISAWGFCAVSSEWADCVVLFGNPLVCGDNPTHCRNNRSPPELGILRPSDI